MYVKKNIFFSKKNQRSAWSGNTGKKTKYPRGVGVANGEVRAFGKKEEKPKGGVRGSRVRPYATPPPEGGKWVAWGGYPVGARVRPLILIQAIHDLPRHSFEGSSHS